jgi:hypothetical protein
LSPFREYAPPLTSFPVRIAAAIKLPHSLEMVDCRESRKPTGESENSGLSCAGRSAPAHGAPAVAAQASQSAPDLEIAAP